MSFHTLLRFAAAALWFLSPSLRAAAPANDKVVKAQVLTGLSGEVLEASNLGATLEPGEPDGNGNGHSIWYSYTAPADGYLEISHDINNDASGDVAFQAFILSKPNFLGFYTSLNDTSRDEGTRTIHTLACARGTVVKLQFDEFFFGPQVSGQFAFSYRFLTGAAFVIQGATRPNGGFTWRENEGPIVLTIARVGSTEGSASVDYSLIFISADSGTDLATGGDPLSGTLTFGPGESRKVLTFPINNDAVAETAETLELLLSNPSAGNVLLEPLADLNIEDDDGTPGAADFFSGAVAITGDSGNGSFPAGLATSEPGEPQAVYETVWLKYTAPADGLLTVTTTSPASMYLTLYEGGTLDTLQQHRPVDAVNALSSIDYAGLPDTATFVVHSGETYPICLSGYKSTVLGDSTYSFALDRTISTFHFSKEVYRGGENGTVDIVVKREGGSAAATVDYTTSVSDQDPEDANFDNYGTPFANPGFDYAVDGQTLTFAAGEMEKHLSIPITKDTKKEGTEHFFVRLRNPIPGLMDAPDHAIVLISDKAPAPEKFPFAHGTYAGALVSGGPGGEGIFTTTLAAAGSFTGSVVFSGKKYAFKSAFPALSTGQPGDTTSVSFHIVRKNLPDLVVNLRYRIEDTYLPRIVGLITDGTSVAEFIADPHALNYPQDVIGMFTAVLTPDGGIPTAIRQPGYLSINVAKGGTIKVLGGLPDGTKVSGTGYLTQNAAGPFQTATGAVFLLPLYAGAGQLSGQLHLTAPGDRSPVPAAGDGDGTLHWVHPVLTKGPVLTAFNANFSAFVSRLTIPKGGLPFAVAAPTAIDLGFADGGLPSGTTSGTYTVKGAITFPANTTGKPSVKFDAKTGLFSGKYTPTGATKAFSFQGVLSRNRSDATGTFLNGTTAGQVHLGFH